MNNSFPRDGVRVNSGGVYKGADANLMGPKYEYVEAPRHNGAVLAIGLIVVGLIVFAVLHPDMVKAVLGL